MDAGSLYAVFTSHRRSIAFGQDRRWLALIRHQMSLFWWTKNAARPIQKNEFPLATVFKEEELSTYSEQSYEMPKIPAKMNLPLTRLVRETRRRGTPSRASRQQVSLPHKPFFFWRAVPSSPCSGPERDQIRQLRSCLRPCLTVYKKIKLFRRITLIEARAASNLSLSLSPLLIILF